jgi:transposase
MSPSEAQPVAPPAAGRFVGCDVHKRQITVCILDAAGQVLARTQLPATRPAITAFAHTQLRPTDALALEATTNTWAVVELLETRVARVVVSNPLTTQAIASAKVKTDKIDARVLADLLRCGYLPEVWQPDPATRHLRRLTSRRAALSSDRTAIKNRLHATLAMRLIAPPVPDLFSVKGLVWLRACATADSAGRAPNVDDETRAALASDLRLLDLAQAEVDALDLTLATFGYHEPKVKLLMSLPGVDSTTAVALLAAWGDTTRFRDAAHAVSYLGLAPSTRQSDAHCHHGPITKRGENHARWLLVQAAQHCDAHPGPLGVFFRRLAKKKNRNVAVVATARKLALIAWHMLQHNEPYRYAMPAATEAKLARLRLRAGGARRRNGACKGQKSVSRSAAGGRTRTIKALATVYELENLPATAAVKPAESRMLAAMGVSGFVAGLAQPRIVRRHLPPNPTPAERPHDPKNPNQITFPGCHGQR